VLLAAPGCTPSRDAKAPLPGSTLAELRALAPVERTIVARLSVPQAYRRCGDEDSTAEWQPATCGEPVGERTVSPEVLALAARAVGAARAQGDADALATAALIDLVWGDGSPASLDAVIAGLEGACLAAERCGDARSDLSAAYLVRARVRREASDLLAAIDAATRAVLDDSANVPARFNLALALERAGLVDVAEQAWGDVERLERQPGWRGEAVAHRRALQRVREAQPAPALTASLPGLDARIASDPQWARLQAFDHLLPAWGEGEVAGDRSAATTALALATRVGDALAAMGGDRSVQDAVARIRSALAEERPALAMGHARYGRAVRAFEQSRYEESAALLDSVLTASPPADALHGWARFYHVGATLHLYPAREARRRFHRQWTQTDSARFAALRARLTWGMTTAALRDGDFHAAAESARQAQSAFARLGEAEHLGAVRYLEGAARHEAGDERLMFTALVASVRALRSYRRSTWLRSALTVTATASAARYPRAAQWLRSEAILVAERAGDRSMIASAVVARARSSLALGELTRARADAHRVDSLLRDFGDVAIGRWIRAERLQVEGALALRDGRAADAATRFDSAAAILAETAVPSRELAGLLARADARRAVGDDSAALHDLERAASLATSMRGSLRGAEARADFATAAATVFDRLVLGYARAGRWGEAWQAVERGRGEGEPPASTATARPVASRAAATGVAIDVRPPPGEAVIDMHLAGDSLVTFVAHARGMQAMVRAVHAGSLLRTVGRVTSAMERAVDRDAMRADLTWLHEQLLRDVVPQLALGDSLLRVVASGALANIPFAALIDPSTGRYLVERSAISVHRSRRDALVSAQGRAVRRPSAPSALLLVADPAFDTTAFPGLPRLPFAGADADLLPAIYRRARVLRASDATVPAIRTSLAGADVLHLSAHTVFDDRAPERSVLVLAKSPGSDRLSSIDAAELRRWRLPGLGLVVLASCQSAMTGRGSGAGLLGFAAALRAAGAQGVVGTLWRIDDEAAHHFARAFHEAYARGGDAARALRATQLQLLQAQGSTLTPATWAGFTYTGY